MLGFRLSSYHACHVAECSIAQVNAGSIAPITAVQFGANRFYEVTLKKLTGRDSSQAGQIAVAVAAGSTSSLISCPAELIMIQQGRNQRPLLAEAKSYIARHGLTSLYRGFVSFHAVHILTCVARPTYGSTACQCHSWVKHA